MIITRPVEQARSLAGAVQARGATVVVRPTIEVLRYPERLIPRLTAIEDYDGVILTSANAARALRDAAQAAGIRPDQMPPCAVVGQATAKVVVSAGWRLWPDIESGSGAALAERLATLPPHRWLYPHGDLALRTVPEILASAGHDIVAEVCYETRPVTLNAAEWLEWLASPDVFLTWFSPSAVAACAVQCQGPGGLPDAARHACIGSTTAAACRRFGLPVTCVASEPTEAALVAAMDAALFNDELGSGGVDG